MRVGLFAPVPPFARRVDAPRCGCIALVLTTSLSLLCGCDVVVYSLSAVRGELELLSLAVPIEEALEDQSLSDEQREKLAFIIRARDYGENVVGLNVASSFRTFANLHDRSLAWNLSASAKDRFEPYIWQMPIIGATPYLGYFNYDQAIVERDRLLASGYDTVLYEVDAYSTLGVLPDPVASPLLKRDLISLADTVLHELLHNTIFTGDTNYNESLATFVGRTAGVAFLRQEFGPDAAIVTEAVESYEDGDRVNAFLQDLAARLNVLYATELSSDEKIEARRAIFDEARARFVAEVQPALNRPGSYQSYATLPYNNAFLLLNTRYNTDLHVFEGIYELTGRDWGAALAVFFEADNTSDPVGYLKSLLVDPISP